MTVRLSRGKLKNAPGEWSALNRTIHEVWRSGKVVFVRFVLERGRRGLRGWVAWGED
jgi:hypothetical protein